MLMLALPAGSVIRPPSAFALYYCCTARPTAILLTLPFPDLKQVGLGLCTTVIGGHSPHDGEISTQGTMHYALKSLDCLPPVSCGSYGPGWLVPAAVLGLCLGRSRLVVGAQALMGPRTDQALSVHRLLWALALNVRLSWWLPVSLPTACFYLHRSINFRAAATTTITGNDSLNL